MQYIGTGRLGTHQSIAYTGTAGTIANGFGSQTRMIRVACTSDAYLLIGDGSPTATTAAVYMPAGSVEYFTVTPGQKASAIQLSAGGTLHVTEMA